MTPASVTWNMASASGMHGESTIFATRVPFFPLRRYNLYVLLWATMCPPMASVGSPKNWSGFAMTWFVT